MISAIVAVDQNWGIGYNGKLLARIPEDLKRFKELTTGNIVVMGRKTWNSLPVNPLPNRTNIIITKNPIYFATINGASRQDLEYTIQEMTSMKNDFEWFIIGGGEIYKQLLPYCDRVYVTKIEKSYKDVDTYFPDLDQDPKWEVSTCTELKEYESIPYAFLTYDRIS